LVANQFESLEQNFYWFLKV